jgi:uncharacterized protein YdhG (YjbR/CyaY superfamily)
MARRAAPSTVDEYIAGFPTGVQRNLRVVRRVIRAAIPEATETIGYRIPAYRIGGPVIYVAAFASHIGLYPAPTGTPVVSLSAWRPRHPHLLRGHNRSAGLLTPSAPRLSTCV